MKCWVCGKPDADITRNITTEYSLYGNITTRKPVKTEHQRCYCQSCFDKMTRQLREENARYIELKRKRMFEKALNKLERQKINFYKYEEAIKTIQDYHFENDGKFDSSEEIMAAIILIFNRYHIKPQSKVGDFQVDFLLPDDKIVLEVDGIHHTYSKGRDSVRDECIKSKLGKEWEIIRIPTELIDEDVKKLPKAIEKVLDYRDTHKVDWRSL